MKKVWLYDDPVTGETHRGSAPIEAAGAYAMYECDCGFSGHALDGHYCENDPACPACGGASSQTDEPVAANMEAKGQSTAQ